MDLKTFAEDDFDPKTWINRAWSTSGNQEKEVFVANTVSRLQLYMKQLTNSLDETTTQIVNSIPRALQDAAGLQVEGALLQQHLAGLQGAVRGVEEQTGHSILSLQRIDQLKSRLENAASALREADKWAALATALEDALEAGAPAEPERLAAQVAALTASLEVLADAPDYESKRLQLEALYNRLEAALSGPFLAALGSQDRERSASYVALYRGMRRMPAAGRCWRRAAGAALAARWSGAPGGLARLLAAPSPPQHLEWAAGVLRLEAPRAELLRLYIEVLQALEPPPTKVVEASLKLCAEPEDGINVLLDVRRDCDEFLRGVRHALEPPGRETVPAELLSELGRAAYAPLRALLPAYSELQRRLLLSQLPAQPLPQEDILEQSRAILAVAERSSGWLEAAAARARGLAGPAAAPHLAPAAEAFFAALSALISTHSRRIEAEFTAGPGSAGVLSAACPAALTLGRAAAAALQAASAQGAPEAEPPSEDPLLDLPALLLEAEERARLEEARAPPPAAAALRRATGQLRALARRVVWSPIDCQLDKIPSLDVWSNNDALSSELPDFALSPQEYITEIGQYLMTLPQHLEMHLTEKQAPWQFLAEICTHTCELYAERILSIRNMDALGTRRCLTDIVYLSSVVEDLGTSVTPALKNLERSLRSAAPPAAE